MESIKPLPERVRSAMRSGFIISDMIRVVEELVYNSLDAGSTKVLVSVGVATGYVKVEDNGCGISRDGLALLGERYATSKRHTFSATSSGFTSFGNRGEALCSIADVSLLEVITKAKGRPNGYRKIMKDSKCLYLGIDDDRWDTGTTVIVHDMFYNQPVRRTHMQISPKKVLHSIKKCVLQIALVWPQVSFSIFDIESEGELLRTHASSSPLAILISHFGIKVTQLRELSLSKGPFELAGYISSSPETFSTKGIQHIYINSRFIEKSPIHKLLNGLASALWEQLNSNQGGKRSRSQACPAYCLNLSCPQSLYDLNIEQLKTSVEFKDWLPLLSFIENSVATLWSSRASHGKLFSSTADQHHTRKEADIIASTGIDAEFLDSYEIPKKRCRIQCIQSSEPAFDSPLFPMEAVTREISRSSYYKGSKVVTRPSIGELKDDFYWTCPSKSYNHPEPGCNSPIMDFTDHPWDFTDKLTTVSEDRNLSSTVRDRSSVHDCFSLEEMAESPVRTMANYDRNKAEMSPENFLTFQFEDNRKPFWQFCSLPENANFTPLKNRSSLENMHDVASNCKERFEFYSNHQDTIGDYIDPCGNKLSDIDSERIPSQEDFMEDAFSTRKHNSFQEDQVSSQEMDACPRTVVASHIKNEPDPGPTHYLPSRFQDVNGLFLRNCSSLKNTNEFIDEKWSSFQSDDGVQGPDSMKIQPIDENLDEFQRRMWQDNVSIPFPFNDSNAESARPEALLFPDQEYSAAGHDKYNSEQGFRGFEGSFHSSGIDCEDMNSDAVFGANSRDFEHQSHQEKGGNARSRNHANFKYFKHEKKDFGSCDFDDGFSLYKDYSNSHFRNGCEKGDRDTDDSYLLGNCSSGKPSASQSNILGRETELTCPLTNEGFTASSSLHESPIHVKGVPKIRQPRSDMKHRDINKARRKRSHSAPPMYRGKRRFFSMNAKFTSVVPNPDRRIPAGGCEIKKGKVIQYSSSQCYQFPETSPFEGFALHTGQKIKEAVNLPDVTRTWKGNKLNSPLNAKGNCEIKKENIIQHTPTQFDQFPETSPIEGFPLHTGRKMKEAANMQHVTMTRNGLKFDTPLPTSDTTDLGVKWRNGCLQAGCEDLHSSRMIREKSINCRDKHIILDVSSGILRLASDTIVPKFINRNCLEASKALTQVDKKFIPVVAGKTLGIIDQHAADERIRLEELRPKVLSGKMRTVAYLEEEKEMMLPETVCQLLHNYTNQIKHWGWICNIFQDSQSFSKNLNVLNKQPGTIRLLAVPCILGVKLSDTDLLEFVKQLADTDGSSTVPPSVLRILNYKACRGAIMFGDTLLPSECSLIVEELKRTSLCFQCAHGRPTMAPLVNLEALHKQIEKLGLSNKDSCKSWHGLCRQPISLERAKQRLGTGKS